MFNAIARVWDHGQQAHNAYTQLMVTVQRFTRAKLKRNCYVYRLLAC
jgi:hypothetical protein